MSRQLLKSISYYKTKEAEFDTDIEILRQIFLENSDPFIIFENYSISEIGLPLLVYTISRNSYSIHIQNGSIGRVEITKSFVHPVLSTNVQTEFIGYMYIKYPQIRDVFVSEEDGSYYINLTRETVEEIESKEFISSSIPIPRILGNLAEVKNFLQYAFFERLSKKYQLFTMLYKDIDIVSAKEIELLREMYDYILIVAIDASYRSAGKITSFQMLGLKYLLFLSRELQDKILELIEIARDCIKYNFKFGQLYIIKDLDPPCLEIYAENIKPKDYLLFISCIESIPKIAKIKVASRTSKI